MLNLDSLQAREQRCRQQAERKLTFQCATMCTCDVNLSSPPASHSAGRCYMLLRALNCTSPSTMECRHILSRLRSKASRWNSCSRHNYSCLAHVHRCLKPRWRCFPCHRDLLLHRQWKLLSPFLQGRQQFFHRHLVPTRRCRCQCVEVSIPKTQLQPHLSHLHRAFEHRQLLR